MSATWNFYVDPAATNTLYIAVSNVLDTAFTSVSGSPFALIALTGFHFSLSVPSSSSATFSNQFAVPRETPLGSGGGPLDMIPEWNVISASGPTDNGLYQIGTSSVSDAFTYFFSVLGDTRIFGGGKFQFKFDPSVDLLDDVNFGTLNVMATNGEGAYAEAGTLTYASGGGPTVAVSISSSDLNLATNTATVTFAFNEATTDFRFSGVPLRRVAR